MNPKYPAMDNRVALLVTLVAAAVLFSVFMLVPGHAIKTTDTRTTSTRAFPGTLSGKDLFREACVQCHTLPTLNPKSPDQWRLLVLKMNRYMAQMGYRSLSPGQVENVVDYIVSHQKAS